MFSLFLAPFCRGWPSSPLPNSPLHPLPLKRGSWSSYHHPACNPQQRWRPKLAASEPDALLCFKVSVMHKRWLRLWLQHSGWYQKHFLLGAQWYKFCKNYKMFKHAWLWKTLISAIYVSSWAFMPKFIYIIHLLCYVLLSFYNKLYISANFIFCFLLALSFACAIW